ncbi:hypothetical protein KI387_015112, partial [Taxus chinensis]
MWRINLKKPDISFDQLKHKIPNVLELNDDSRAITLKYVDEDGDVICLSDEDDFNEAIRQELNPFQVEVSRHKPRGIVNLGPFGGGGGTYDWNDRTFKGIKAITIPFKYPTEKLRKMSGYCGLVCGNCTIVKGLTFETNVKKYGLFGVRDWIPFESEIKGE